MAFRGAKLKAILMLLLISALDSVSAFEKCSEAPKDICGPNAKCLDDYTYTVNGINSIGSVCKCNDHFFGTPPKCRCEYNGACKEGEFCTRGGECKVGCRPGKCEDHQYCDPETGKCLDGCVSSYDCDHDEFCNKEAKKCVKICENYPCPANSTCTAKYRTKYCSCDEGYYPRKEKGCRPKTPGSKYRINCRSKCGENSRCSIENNKIYCSCPNWNVFHSTPVRPPMAHNRLIHIPDYNPFYVCPLEMMEVPSLIVPTGDSSIISLAAIANLAG